MKHKLDKNEEKKEKTQKKINYKIIQLLERKREKQIIKQRIMGDKQGKKRKNGGNMRHKPDKNEGKKEKQKEILEKNTFAIER